MRRAGKARADLTSDLWTTMRPRRLVPPTSTLSGLGGIPTYVIQRCGLSLASLGSHLAHCIWWNDEFPTTFELWLWRASSIASMVTMAVFMQFKQVVVDWKDPLMAIKIAMPLLYLLSRLAIMAVAFAALRASDPAVYTTPAVSKYWLHV